ncbi:hypothetical protein ACRZ6Q_004218 [Citrobacter freundii]|uniref:hypothetical protein n=1 Tax=Enterobacteriaceae TaxID=543 RepID=UPI0008F8BD35|nr:MULTISPECIES: hypothetical protein [Enterobacteriaceae]EJN7218963.1 hypothetical protein [Citrobacter freundii]MBD5703348.1 hypothetical protein [Citrobacter freundii]MCD2460906.1 hypothetical protein [Enterobacter cloacae complex sp. 2021EL-01261]MDW3091929.1 hypothetical protein [Citrobacter freundii]OIK42883.1 hypothetical protein BED30_17325 [Citrobacter portucalensis]
MRKLKGCILLALFYSVNIFAAPPNVWLQCANGVHATIKDYVLSAEGIINLPFEHTENETDEQIDLVFADARTEAKVRIQYTDAKFFLKDTNGSWSPCNATKIP